jgi:hypothetical protein
MFDKWTGNTTSVANVNSSSTTVTMPAGNVVISATYKSTPPPTCTFTLVQISQHFGSAGGSGQVSVGTQDGCSWVATSNATWVKIVGSASGTGNNSHLSYTVDANTGVFRPGTITIAGLTFTITEDAGSPPPPPVCTVTLSPTSKDFNYPGGTAAFNVTAPVGCSWTAVSSIFWIAVTGNPSGTGNGVVTYLVAGNSGAVRIKTIIVGDATFTITQTGPG